MLLFVGFLLGCYLAVTLRGGLWFICGFSCDVCVVVLGGQFFWLDTVGLLFVFEMVMVVVWLLAWYLVIVLQLWLLVNSVGQVVSFMVFCLNWL